MIRLFLIIALIACGAGATAQRVTRAEAWDEQAKSNIRLLPKYGYRQKTDEQKQIDQKFITETLKQLEYEGDRVAASKDMILTGFAALQRNDLKAAMYRFNEAYLLDSTNADIYWGYGAVYMAVGAYENAQKQYIDGLKLAPRNAHLLTEYGTYYMAQYYGLQSLDEKTALANLDSAISYLLKSWQVDPKSENTSFKLSVCYWLKGSCKEARKFYNECKALGGAPITEEYTNDLNNKCPQ